MTILYLFIGVIIGMVLMALCAAASDRREANRIYAALWEVIDGMRMVDVYHIGVRAILEKHGIEIPEGEVVF